MSMEHKKTEVVSRRMDPPGSFHAMTTQHHTDDADNYSNENEAEDVFDQKLPSQEEPSQEEQQGEESNRTTGINIPAPESVAAAVVNDDDLQAMRPSLSMATQNYQAYVSMGGTEITSKSSIDSRRVLVAPLRSSATTTTTTTTAVSRTRVETPTITTAAATITTTTTTATAAASHTGIVLDTPVMATAVLVEGNNDNDPPAFMTSSQSQQPHRASSTLQSQVPTEQNTPSQERYNAMVHRLVSEQNYPCGLAKRLVTCVQTQFVKHYWLVDNSGSMLTTDCVRMVQKDIFDVGGSNTKKPKKMYDTIKCSRWNELEHAIISHIDVASILEVPTTFRLLEGNMGMQEFTINQSPGDVESAKSIVRQSKPEGVTLLSNHIHEICKHIEEDMESLLEKGQKVVVVIATDAIPSDLYGETSEEATEKFFDALKKLQLLPVWIVIRLCTNDRKTMKYYRKLDKKLEIPIECVSDYITENKEVRKWNPWLNYSRQLHQCREMGSHHRVFDLLDERPLTKDDLLDFLMVLIGAEVFDTNIAPSVHTDWDGFLQYLKNQVLNQCEKQYSPITKKMEDIVDVKGIEKAHSFFGSIRNAMNKIEY